MGAGNDAIRYSSRDIDVIALLEFERTEIRFDGAFAAVNEDQFVAICIPVVERHRLRAPRYVEGHVIISEECHWRAVSLMLVAGRQAVQVEAMRGQLAFEANPSGGRGGVVRV